LKGCRQRPQGDLLGRIALSIATKGGSKQRKAPPRMHNGIDPGRLSPAERLAEIAEILTAGLMRLRARQSSALSAPGRDSFLDFPPPQSGRGRKPRCRVVGQ
jgi:hypothetical protein